MLLGSMSSSAYICFPLLTLFYCSCSLSCDISAKFLFVLFFMTSTPRCEHWPRGQTTKFKSPPTFLAQHWPIICGHVLLGDRDLGDVTFLRAGRKKCARTIPKISRWVRAGAIASGRLNRQVMWWIEIRRKSVELLHYFQLHIPHPVMLVNP